jgi:hypothetical protein
VETFLNILAGVILTVIAAALWRANLEEGGGSSPETLTGTAAGQSVRFNPAALLLAARRQEEQQ